MTDNAERQKRFRRHQEAPVRIERHGLCPACRNSSKCVLMVHSGLSVVFCRQFEPDDKVPTPQEAVKNMGGKSLGKKASAKTRKTVKGLCVDCAKFGYCQLSKSEEGVWHCEDYP